MTWELRYPCLVNTNFVLVWRADKQLERRVTRQLNKGEALQALRRYLGVQPR